jgi:acetyl-CoA C-acetyltransferase
MKEAVIVSYARTPFGRFGGGLAPLSATELGGLAIKEAVRRAGIDASVPDYAYMGQATESLI